MSDLFKIFFNGGMARQLFAIFLLTLIALSQTVTLAALLPLLASLDDSGPAGIKGKMAPIFAALGVDPTLYFLLSVMIGAAIIRFGLVGASMHFIMYEVTRIASHLRILMIEALLKARWAYFTAQPVGRFANSVSEEATEASECYMYAGTAISNLIRFAIYVGFVLIVQLEVAVGVLLAVPFIWAMLRGVRLLATRAGKRRTARTRELSIRIADSLSNMKPLKASGRHVQFLSLIKRDTRRVKKTLRRETMTEELMRNVQEPIAALLLCGGLYLMVTIWHQPLSSTLALALLVVGALDSFQVMQASLQRVLLQRSAFWSIQKLIEDAHKIREKWSGRTPPRLEQGITLHHIDLSLNGRRILDDVNLRIGAGEITTLIGPSGAGKTTIADVITGLLPVDGGEVSVDGVPLSQLDLGAWRSRIGYVPQENVLLNDSIFMNVSLGDPRITESDVEEALQAAGLWDFVEGLPNGIQHGVGERGMMLSGGQRQRVSIARALVAKPLLLILDEATSALDQAMAQEICDRIRELRGKVTILVITHQSLWLNISDRVYRIAEGGSATELPSALTSSLQGQASAL